MRIRPWITLFKDLVHVLPARPPLDWEDMGGLKSDRPTVVLISGFAGTQRALDILRRRLLRDGYNVVLLALDKRMLADGVHGFYRLAEKLSTTVLKLHKESTLTEKRFYLVAHSAGGLVARYYVQLLGGWNYCEGLLTLATPHNGTWFALLGIFSPLVLAARCLLQMLPTSAFVRALKQSSLPEGFRIVSAYSSEDRLCPPSSAQVHSKARVEHVHLRGLSHGDFLLSKRSYAVLCTFLDSFDRDKKSTG